MMSCFNSEKSTSLEGKKKLVSRISFVMVQMTIAYRGGGEAIWANCKGGMPLLQGVVTPIHSVHSSATGVKIFDRQISTLTS